MAEIDSLRQVSQTRAPFSAWLGIVLLFALFGIIVLAIIGPAPRGDRYEQKRAQTRMEKLKAVREEEGKTLNTFAWIDKEKGIARIPIDHAMKLTTAELAQKKPAPANPIATPPPQTAPVQAAPSPTAAPATSPRPAGTPKATSVEGPESESRGQPAAAAKPPAAQPGTQPGAAATPAASPAAPSGKPAVSPSAIPLPAVTPTPAPTVQAPTTTQ